MAVVAVAMNCYVVEKERKVSHQLHQLPQGSYLEAVVQASLSYYLEGAAGVDTFPLKMEGPLVGEEGEDMAHQAHQGGTGDAPR